MASDVKVKLNRRAVRDLLRGKEVRAELARRGKRIADAAGPGHVVSVSEGRNRARVAVITATPEAMEAEAKSHRLSGALDAGRG